MKHCFSVLFAAAAALILPLSGAEKEKPWYGSSRPKREIRIGKTAFVLDRSAQAEIIVEKSAGFLTRYAASELQNYLNAVTGKKFPVVNQPSGKAGISIFIGCGPWLKEAKIDPAKFCRDSFVIRTAGKKLYIAGRDDAKQGSSSFFKGGIWDRMYEKGTLFGVYDFLERFAGVRFYYPVKEFIIVPKKASLAVPEINIYDRPDFEFRRVSIYKGVCEDSIGQAKPYRDHISPMKNLYYTYLRLQTRYIPNNHGSGCLGYIDRFGKTHPEYFAKLSDGSRSSSYDKYFPGQFCYSSPGLFEELYKDGVALLTGKSAASRGIVSPYKKRALWSPASHQEPTATRPGIFGMMPQDGFQPCMCAECQKHFSRGAQETSNYVWKRFADLSRRFQKAGIPGYTSQMAYPPYRLIPETDIPSNLLVMLAGSGPWESSPVNQKRDLELLRAWNKKVGYKVWMWNYLCKWGKLELPDVPASTPYAVGRYYKSIAKDTTGAYMQSDTDRMAYNMLNYYVFAKIAWNNDLKTVDLLEEHYRLCYGKAFNQMRAFFKGLDTLWMTKIGGRTADTPLGPLSVPPSEQELWMQIFNEKELAGLKRWLDISCGLCKNDPAALFRINWVRKNFYDPLAKRAEEYRTKNAAIGGFLIPMEKKADGSFCKRFYLQPFNLSGRKSVGAYADLTLTSGKVLIKFFCEEPEMAKIASVPRKFDDQEVWKDDEVEIFLAPAGAGKQYYHFLLNSQGSFSDRICESMGSKVLGNFTWNSGAKVVRTAGKNFWQMQIEIPRSAFPKFNEKEFLVNFGRSRALKGWPETQLYSVSPFLHTGFNEIENFARVTMLPQKANVIAGGDFEGLKRDRNMIGKWIIHSPMEVVLDKECFIKGGQSLKITIPKKLSPRFNIVRQSIKLVPGKKYRLSFYLKLDNIIAAGKNPGVSIKVCDSRNHFYPRTFMTGRSPWQRQVFEFTAEPPVKGRAYEPVVDIHCYNAYGTFHVDALSIEEL